MKAGTRVLLVEDDRSISELLELELGHRNLDVRCAYDGLSALEIAESFRPEVVILDIMLPGIDGVGVLKGLRRRGDGTPVLMLTARDTLPDKVHSLEMGADDYLTKPFHVEELLARLGALVRRVQGDEVIRFSDLEINTTTREVRRGEREMGLTVREYGLLEFMARNPRRVLSRDLLLERVWDSEVGLETKVVDVYIGYLRKKVDVPQEKPLIQTIRGVGYALREP